MRKKGPDPILLGISVALLFLGILILASVSASFSLIRSGTTSYFLNHQLLFGMLPGIILGYFVYRMPLEKLKKWSVWLLLGNLVLLVLVFLPGLGITSGGAHRWVNLYLFTLQPSELLKLTFILYLANWLSSRTEHKKQTLLPFIALLGFISMLLILQPDISTLGLIGLIAVILYFAAGTPVWHTPLFIGFGFGALYLLIKLAPYRLSRLAVFLDPSLDPLGQGYQSKQALIGIGSGGLTGVGLGLSFQKFGVLPEPISDSIFAVFAEEIGFVGAFILIFLFVAFLWRNIQLATKTQDTFAKLTVIGIASWITLQAFINIGAMVGLLPLTGIPLPFISYGGSALVTELIGLGILLNISKQT